MILFFSRFCQEVTTLKRFFLFFLCFVSFCGCTVKETDEHGYLIFPEIGETAKILRDSTSQNAPIRACWLSYLEWNPKRIKDEAVYRDYMKSMLAPLRRIGTTDLFLQVRAFADANYPSSFFESSAWVVGRRGDPFPFDYLSVFIEEAQIAGMRVHAWINPYRVLADTAQTETLGKSTVIERLLRRQEGLCFMKTASGLYLQPGSLSAQKLILNGVRELLENYPIVGIHLDDYFYPPDVGNEDAVLYKAYQADGGSLSLHDWRCEQVDTLLQRIYALVHTSDEGRVLSVSPGGDPQRDEAVHCADVAKWCKEKGYCDWLVPQLYYGFKNESMPFEKTARIWKKMNREPSIRLIGGLAVYKIGKTDLWAGEKGKEEWMQEPELIAKQAKTLDRLGYDGCALFSAQFVNFQEKVCVKAFHFFEPVL